ncbi:hypothetical protein LRS71_23445 [Rhodococcus pyridinivorans]|nr:hypothetical protein [Rhodococcus pyridinivorans]MCD5422472.1 hypothetical protein [Rhodococcus pyridinivorans]
MEMPADAPSRLGRVGVEGAAPHLGLWVRISTILVSMSGEVCAGER